MNFIPKGCPSFIIPKERIGFIPKRGLRRSSFENERAVINLNRKSMINLYMISFLNDDHIFHIPMMVIERADLKEKVI